MNEQIFKKKINSLQDDMRRLNNAIFTLAASNYKHYPENFLKYSLDTAIRAEKLACKFRHIVSEYGMVKREPLMERVVEAHDMKIWQDGETIVITIPRLLPKINRIRNSDFINQPLHYALHRYCAENRVEKYRHCTVCFVHVYDEKLSLRRIRDYDNTETRNVLNTVATFLMLDDSGQWCDAYHATELGKADCTRIYIMPQDAFPHFIIRQKRNPKIIPNPEKKSRAEFRYTRKAE
jgi:hypothetical protein